MLPRLLKLAQLLLYTTPLTLANAKISRTCEKEADIEAYTSMPENKQGFIDLFTTLRDETEQNKKSKFKIKQYILDKLDPILKLFHNHPMYDERIAYINEL